MVHLLGGTTFVFGFIITYGLARGRPSLISLLLTAYMIRVFAALINFYVVPLPDSMTDALTFERVAWEISGNFLSGVVNFEYGPSYYYSMALAAAYTLTDRSMIMLQMFSVIFGTICVYLTWILVRELWHIRSASCSAWILAVFPTAILYSAMTRREVFFTTFLIIGLIYTVRWMRIGHFRYLLVAGVAFAIGVLVHGGMAVALFALGLIVIAVSFLRLNVSLLRGSVPLFSLMVIVLTIVITAAVLVVDPRIPKLGTITGLFDPQMYVERLSSLRGNARYPDFLAAQLATDLLWVVPLRIIYFLLSPFPWDVSEMSHLSGLVDSVLYAIAIMAIVLNWRAIMRNPAAFAILFILICLVIAFAIGTNNFGAAIRHRSKFLPVLLVLGAPAFATAFTRLRSHRRYPMPTR